MRISYLTLLLISLPLAACHEHHAEPVKAPRWQKTGTETYDAKGKKIAFSEIGYNELGQRISEVQFTIEGNSTFKSQETISRFKDSSSDYHIEQTDFDKSGKITKRATSEYASNSDATISSSQYLTEENGQVTSKGETHRNGPTGTEVYWTPTYQSRAEVKYDPAGRQIERTSFDADNKITSRAVFDVTSFTEKIFESNDQENPAETNVYLDVKRLIRLSHDRLTTYAKDTGSCQKQSDETYLCTSESLSASNAKPYSQETSKVRLCTPPYSNEATALTILFEQKRFSEDDLTTHLIQTKAYDSTCHETDVSTKYEIHKSPYDSDPAEGRVVTERTPNQYEPLKISEFDGAGSLIRVTISVFNWVD